MIVVAIIALALLGVAVALVASAVLEPRIRRSENLAQIEAYGYAGIAEANKPAKRRRGHVRRSRELDRATSSPGES